MSQGLTYANSTVKLASPYENILNEEQFRHHLVETQRLAGVGTLAAGVAHELTNPINVITATCNNMLSLFSDGGLGESELIHYIDMIEQNAARCANLIQAMGNYAYMNGGDFTPCGINQIIELAISLVRYEFERQNNISIDLDLDRELAPIACNQNQIIQVLVNLLINARDALAPGGGTILISSRSIPEQNAQAFCVVDDGPGIDNKIYPFLFDPFVTTKEDGKGTGLGLAISKKILEEHNGRITAVNNKYTAC